MKGENVAQGSLVANKLIIVVFFIIAVLQALHFATTGVLIILGVPQSDPGFFWWFVAGFAAMTPFRVVLAVFAARSITVRHLFDMEYGYYKIVAPTVLFPFFLPLLVFGVIAIIWRPNEYSLPWSLAATGVLAVLYAWHRRSKRREKRAAAAAAAAQALETQAASLSELPHVQPDKGVTDAEPQLSGDIRADQLPMPIEPASPAPIQQQQLTNKAAQFVPTPRRVDHLERQEQKFTWLPAHSRPRERSAGVTALLFIVTLGVYGFVWLAKMHNEYPRRQGADPSAAVSVWGTLVPALIGIGFLVAGGIPVRNQVFVPHEATAMFWLFAFGFLLIAHVWYAFVTYRLTQRFHHLLLQHNSPSNLKHSMWHLYAALFFFFTEVCLTRWERFGIIDLPDAVTVYVLPTSQALAMGLAYLWWKQIHDAANTIAKHTNG